MNVVADIWSVLTRRQRRWTLAALLLSIVMAFSTIAGIASIAPFFSVLGNPQAIDDSRLLHALYVHFGFTDRRAFEVGLGLAFAALVLAANVINAAGSYFMVRLAWTLGTDLQSVLFAEYLGRPYVFHARTHSAVLFNNIVHETTRATNELLQNVLLATTQMVTAAFIVITVVVLRPLAALAMILVLGGGYVLFYLLARNRLARAGMAQTLFFTEQTRVVNESLAAIKEIIPLGIEGFFAARFRRASRGFGRATAHAQVIGQSPKHLMECIAVAGLVVLALWAAGRGEGIGPSLGAITFLGFAAYRLLPTLQQTFAAIVRIRADHAGFASIAADLRRARAARPCAAAPDAAWSERPMREIRLTDVRFRYDRQRDWAVAGVSMTIPARGIVGLFGANGSGKTTLADLIAGLLAAESGRIEVDGVAVDEAHRAAWQSRIAYLPQSTYLFDATIAENIALGVPPAHIDAQRLAEAAHGAQLDPLIAQLPGGYAFRIGERGISLSGGQRQRLGIARALYRQASVLILDEATHALDGLTEQELLAAVSRLRGRSTIIMVAHRQSTLRACDTLFELDMGRIVRCGGYDDLFGPAAKRSNAAP